VDFDFHDVDSFRKIAFMPARRTRTTAFDQILGYCQFAAIIVSPCMRSGPITAIPAGTGENAAIAWTSSCTWLSGSPSAELKVR
jgi:hypothetical protein